MTKKKIDEGGERKMEKINCPICRQDMNEPPHEGLNGKDCPRCGQGISWRKALRKKNTHLSK